MKKQFVLVTAVVCLVSLMQLNSAFGKKPKQTQIKCPGPTTMSLDKVDDATKTGYLSIKDKDGNLCHSKKIVSVKLGNSEKSH